MSDKYGKSETGDIIEDLNSMKIDRQKDAVKKVISAMTIGRDVSKLFPYVVKCMGTTDIELKKLIYLYIISYARIKPFQALLAVNMFKKDSLIEFNHNALTRALAVRTMGCLGVEHIMQFLCDPLKEALKDKDPYVRKTAALCVAKIYDTNPQLVEEQFGFVDTLQQLVEEEGNSMVISNCIAALIEISTTKGEDIVRINWKKCKHLMNALHDNNEWCQINLLEGISRYNPTNQEEIFEMIERVLPFVSHSNSGVVLTAVKILIKLLDSVESPDTIRTVCKKITPSLVTLLSAEPEIQYVALKNINILIQKRPIIFEKDIRMFFTIFTEPIYNKMEKLDIIYKLVTMNNIDIILNELKENATEVDVQFVRRAVKLIGQCAIKLEKAAQRCVETLVELVKTQVSFVIQEAIIALRDIFRRYPNTFEGAMAIVNENLKSLDDADAKSALIWIIGEYADRIDGAEVQLNRFLNNLKEEPYIVQLQILNSSVKTFLKCQTDESFNVLEQIFEFCRNESDSIDLRERGNIYHRLLSVDPNLAAQIILSEKPRISEDISGMDSILLDKLVENLGTLSTIYSKPPELFVKKTKIVLADEEDENEYEENTFNVEEVKGTDNKIQETEETRGVKTETNLIDFDDIITDNTNHASIPVQQSTNLIDMFSSQTNLLDSFSSTPIKRHTNIPKQCVINENTPGNNNNTMGFYLEAAIERESTGLFLHLSLINKSNNIMQDFEFCFDKNYFGLSINTNSTNSNHSLRGLSLKPFSGEERKLEILSNIQPDITKQPTMDPPLLIQAAIKSNLDYYYFRIPVILFVLFEPHMDRMGIDQYTNIWNTIQTTNDMCTQLNVNNKFQSLEGVIYY
jgi:AP-1 complex subunit beta-1